MDCTLFNGDCMEYLSTMKDKSVDCTLTDIPYGQVNREGEIRNLDKGKADIVTFDLVSLMKEIVRVTKGTIYCFCGKEQMSDIYKTFLMGGANCRLIVWEKTNPLPMNAEYMWLSSIELCVYGRFNGATFNEFCQSSVLRYPTGQSKLHPTQKPLDLIKRLMSASTNEGDSIFDPCMGSGTTGIAAMELKRNFIGCELHKPYFHIAKSRIETAKSENTYTLW